jgi:EpsI family protein
MAMTGKVLLVSLILLIGGAIGNSLRFAEATPDHPPAFSEIPLELSTYYGEERRFSEESYDVLRADTTTLRLYTTGKGERLWLFVGYFASQKYGSQIHSPRNCLPGSGWKIGRIEPYLLRLSDGTTRDINRLIITDRGTRELMLYWFETRGGAIRSEFGLKWDLMRNSLLLRPTDAAIIRLNTPIADSESIDKATERVILWLEQFYPSIERALPFGVEAVKP